MSTYKILFAFALVAAGIISLCTFRVLDRDFWWHVKAGEIMVQTHQLIHTDPFAHTREGLPYVSTHEWLAQVFFYLVWSAGGATGEIIFRGLVVAAAFIGILLIKPKTIWITGFLILIAAYMNRPSFMDRPQLFSFVFFACFLYAAFYYLTRANGEPLFASSWRKWFLLALVCVQLLWVNMHGAAAAYGIMVLCALVAENVFEWIGSTQESSRIRATREIQYLGIVICTLAVAALVSPNGFHTFSDLFVYTSDQTLSLVREWQPRGLGGYTKDILPFWIVAATALVLGKKHRIFSVALLAVLGYLSMQSYRHGIFFIFTTLALAVYSFGDSIWYTRAEALAKRYAARTTFLLLVLLGGMVWYVSYKNISVLQREGYAGYGVAALAEGAYDFLEKADITGRMFNTYAIGDYLLFRGYPDRKVYIDGRNIDYGYEFLREATVAGFDPNKWEEIEKKYGLTYAVIEYPLPPGASSEHDLPYVVHLARNKAWVLVYVDDKVAVYVKDIPEHAKVIKEYGYRFITPEGIEYGKVFLDTEKEDVTEREEELERVASSTSQGIKAKLLLAHYYVDTGNMDKAMKFAQDALKAQPYRPEVYEALGVVYAGKKEWMKAGDAFEKSLSLTGGVGFPINYEYLSNIFLQAGDSVRANKYHQKALKAPL